MIYLPKSWSVKGRDIWHSSLERHCDDNEYMETIVVTGVLALER